MPARRHLHPTDLDPTDLDPIGFDPIDTEARLHALTGATRS